MAAAPRVKNVAVLGHSFVKRADGAQKHSPLQNLGLPAFSHNVLFNGRGGAHIKDIPGLYQQIQHTQPKLILLDIGTNDLFNQPLVSPAVIAGQLHKVARQLAKQTSALVVLVQALPRTPQGRFGAPQSFNQRVQLFNKTLSYLSHPSQGSSSSVKTWYLRGIPSKVEEYVQDGCHLNARGMHKYLKSLRRVVIKYSQDVPT